MGATEAIHPFVREDDDLYVDQLDMVPGRPVVPDDQCDASTRTFRWGHPMCGHDYPPEPSARHWAYREWTCTRCGRVTRMETA